MAAFFKALLEVLVELIRGEIKQDTKATDADAPPAGLRARFLAKYNKLRDK